MPAKTRTKRSRHTHAAAELAAAEAVAAVPLDPPEAPPIKEGIQSCKQSRRGESTQIMITEGSKVA